MALTLREFSACGENEHGISVVKCSNGRGHFQCSKKVASLDAHVHLGVAAEVSQMTHGAALLSGSGTLLQQGQASHRGPTVEGWADCRHQLREVFL